MTISLSGPSVITSGLKPVEPGLESWWVRPGGATVVAVRAGDRLTVRDPDGGQPAEVTVLDAEGGEGRGAAPGTGLGRRGGRAAGGGRGRAAAAAGRAAPGLPRRPHERAQLR